MTWGAEPLSLIAHDYHTASFDKTGQRAPAETPGSILRLESACQRSYLPPTGMASDRGLRKCHACSTTQDSEQTTTLDTITENPS